MPNAVILVEDVRIRQQVEQFLGQLGMDDLNHTSFDSAAAFEAHYFPEEKPAKDNNVATNTQANETKAETALDTPPESAPPTPTASSEQNEKEEEGAIVRFSEIHMIIFALDCIEGKSSPWIDKIKQEMRKHGCYPTSGPLRTVMLKYEDDNIAKVDLLHPNLDDVIFLPIDRLIFLQKLQILLALPKSVSPSFLFNQEVQQSIEISKIVKMDRLSDVGLAIRNPVSLKKGTPAKFYINFESAKESLEIRGKVLRSEPHPDFPDQFLVYFAYFGMNKNELTTVRRALAKFSRYQSLLRDDRDEFSIDTTDPLASLHGVEPAGVAVIDSDDDFGNTLKEALSKDIDLIDAVSEYSLSVFIHKYLSTEGEEDNTPPLPTQESDFYTTPLALTVGMGDLKIVSIEPSPKDEDMFLGFPAVATFMSPDRWIALIQHKESRLIVEESVNLVLQGKTLSKVLFIHDSENQKRAVRFKIFRASTEQNMIVELSPAGIEDILEYESGPRKKIKLNALIVDAAFMPEDPSGWCEGLRQRAVQAEATQDPAAMRFFIVGDSDHRNLPGWFASPQISGYFVKPIDMRLLMFLLSEFLDNKTTIYHFENLGWAQPTLNTHVSKSIKLEALSEYGARLRSSAPIAPGTVFYLRKMIFDKAPNGCLAARVYACEQDPNDKTSYQVFALYFGIGDAFLKYARTWIRDNYAALKAQGGGS